MLKYIEEKALNYESGKMLRSDSEVEIDVDNDEVWLCDYSQERGSAEFIEKLCDLEKVDEDKLIALCDKHNWAYVI